MKGSTLVTLTVVTLVITALYMALGQPEQTPGYFIRNPVGADPGAQQPPSWADQIQESLAAWL